MIRNGPVIYREVLELIKPIFPKAIIAGGACRDFYRKDNSYVPKDIDVFVDVEDELSFEMKYYELKDHPIFAAKYRTNYGKHMSEYDIKDNTENSMKIVGLFNCHPIDFINNARIEIIGKNFEGNFNYQSLIDTFDFDICKTYYDEEQNEIVRSPEFIEALKNRVIGPVKSVNDLTRARRLKGKFDQRLKHENRWTIEIKNEKISSSNHETGTTFYPKEVDVPYQW